MDKIINIIPAPFAVELVYADDDNPGELFSDSIIGFAAVDSDGETGIHPVVMNKHGVHVITEFVDNILGISEKPFKPEDWQEELKIYNDGEGEVE